MPSDDELVVVALMRVMPERRDEVRAALLHQVTRVHAEEPGALLFAAHESADGFVLIEKWDSAESLQRHTSGGAITEYRRVLEPALLEPSEIHVVEPLPAGDPEKGSL